MDCFENAESLRYLDDLKFNSDESSFDSISKIEADLAFNSLRVSAQLTPDIYSSLSEACSNLGLDTSIVKAYVSSSPEIQAGCISVDNRQCIITLTSAIVNLLSFSELVFVFGHELGHFLLGHNVEKILEGDSSEGFLKKRAQEISVDRLGLWACKDINVSSRAMVKTLSGLSDNYLAFDMRAFLGQIDGAASAQQDDVKYSSHPSFILRVKALLRFSLCNSYQQYINEAEGADLGQIDTLIQGDLNKHIDSDWRLEVQSAAHLLSFWSYAYGFIRKGIFSQRSQLVITEKFGADMNQKLVTMISEESTVAAIALVKEKFLLSATAYRLVAPNRASKDFNLMLLEVEKATGNDGLLNEVLRELG